MTPPLFYEDSLGAKAAEAFNNLPSADDELIDDPEALAAAERTVNQIDPQVPSDPEARDWVPVFGPACISGFLRVAGTEAFALTGTLDALGISHAWDPYPPEDMPSFRPYYGAIDRPFTLLVPRAQFNDAQAALAECIGARASAPSGSHPVGASASVGQPFATPATQSASSLAGVLPVPPWPQVERPWWSRRGVRGWVWIVFFIGLPVLLWLVEGAIQLARRL